jgi:hypothetical protein
MIIEFRIIIVNFKEIIYKKKLDKNKKDRQTILQNQDNLKVKRGPT